MTTTQHSIAAFQGRTMELGELDPGRIAVLTNPPAIYGRAMYVGLVERLATELGGIGEGIDWDDYVGLCKAAQTQPRLELFRESLP